MTMPTRVAALADCHLSEVRVLGPFRLYLRFPDNFTAELDFGAWVRQTTGQLAEPLRDPQFFAQVSLDDGVLTWPNTYDISPEVTRLWAEQNSVA